MTEWWQGFLLGAGAHVLWDVGLVLAGMCGGALMQRIKHKHEHVCMHTHICRVFDCLWIKAWFSGRWYRLQGRTPGDCGSTF